MNYGDEWQICIDWYNCGVKVAQWKHDKLAQVGMNSEDWILVSGGDCDIQFKKKKKKKNRGDFFYRGSLVILILGLAIYIYLMSKTLVTVKQQNHICGLID